MNLLCKIFGHQPPVYAQRGWYSPGEQYMHVKSFAIDGIGKEHASITSECPRCKKNFLVGKIHLPTSESERNIAAENSRLRSLMHVGESI